MRVTICENKQDLGLQAARLGIEAIRSAIEKRGEAIIVLATGVSQFILYEQLVASSIPWDKVEAFHLAEYVGIGKTHQASMRAYLQNRFLDKVGSLKAFHPIEGDAEDLGCELKRLNDLMRNKKVDVVFLGIGENGHVAFNDPPANIDTTEPFILVNLEEKNRRQQVRANWFPTLESVPLQAISMSIRQILKASTLICTVPDQRKARAVAMCMFDQISVFAPCAMLRTKEECTLLLDRPSSMLIFGDRR